MRTIEEQVKVAVTPEEMRAEIFRLQHYSPLVRAVMDSASYRGASAEDRYTELAYHALRQLGEIRRHVLDGAVTGPLMPTFTYLQVPPPKNPTESKA